MIFVWKLCKIFFLVGDFILNILMIMWKIYVYIIFVGIFWVFILIEIWMVLKNFEFDVKNLVLGENIFGRKCIYFLGNVFF